MQQTVNLSDIVLRRFKSFPAHSNKNQLNFLVGRFLSVRREQANGFACVRILKPQRCSFATREAGSRTLSRICTKCKIILSDSCSNLSRRTKYQNSSDSLNFVVFGSAGKDLKNEAGAHLGRRVGVERMRYFVNEMKQNIHESDQILPGALLT